MQVQPGLGRRPGLLRRHRLGQWLLRQVQEEQGKLWKINAKMYKIVTFSQFIRKLSLLQLSDIAICTALGENKNLIYSFISLIRDLLWQYDV